MCRSPFDSLEQALESEKKAMAEERNREDAAYADAWKEFVQAGLAPPRKV